MPITDLTGYTWVANSVINELAGFSFAINFTSNNQTFTHIERLQSIEDWAMGYSNIRVYDSGTWTNNAYKTITIAGGTDATNATLIAWLEANGTLTAPQPTGTNNVSIGTLSLAKAILGTTELSAIWLGNNKIYEKGA